MGGGGLICKNDFLGGGLFEGAGGLIRAWGLIRGFTVKLYDCIFQYIIFYLILLFLVD